ncbi:hypothetical protein A3J61_00580 [Candidatus Nomurabacteria bacterium RIFCSPHIGHO2_02_FULL_38_15]|uniref:Uncharacterized protein n=1 Tax=Candidatus Nomurabacteria bacterium RIFCSPHIGHO2_02_FULL_38_15 TaxID=1801752 RepID=A0A1F6VQC9_9BACT|nr:MAG: hypothetical protein A3J61_00580 [Candidatus Nomurabacteria bacterium RIFCSPHIGHO2_02_FULL_38_15]
MKTNNTKVVEKATYTCIETVAADGGKPNFLVRELLREPQTDGPNKIITTIFWMDQNGHALKQAAEKIWTHCINDWQPKPEPKTLPWRLIDPARRTAKMIRHAVQNGLPMDSIFKKTAPEKQPEKIFKTEIPKIELKYVEGKASYTTVAVIAPTEKKTPNKVKGLMQINLSSSVRPEAITKLLQLKATLPKVRVRKQA